MTEPCENCCGWGKVDAICYACSGSGEGNMDGLKCHACRGSGTETHKCSVCDGSGEVEVDDEQLQ